MGHVEVQHSNLYTEVTMSEKLDTKLDGKSYMPDPSIKERSWMQDYETAYKRSINDPVQHWTSIADELEWFKKWDNVLEWEHPDAKWFTNAKMNITYNCLDRHIFNGKRNKVAIIWVGDDGKEQVITYRQLYREVMRFANGLKSLGVEKGDRVCIYMPLVPEQIIAMLACARIGAVHSVVFGGFGSNALHSRIKDAQAKIVITADATLRRGKRLDLKSLVDKAVVNASCVEKVIVLRRMTPPIELFSEIEVDFHDILDKEDKDCEPEVMDSEDPLFVLYTSGTTGPAKGIVHTCAGYMVGTYYTSKYVLDIKDSDVMWCTADPGWITGHSYIVYGPLLAGATIMISEATPDYPDPGSWWSIIQEFDITILYTAPTAIRMLMRQGEEWPKKYNLNSLRVLGSVGEALSPEVFEWYYRVVGRNKCPILDTWWQTETGMHMITTAVGEPMKPGFVGRPVPGIVADVVDEKGQSVPPGVTGHLVIKEPWPSMMRAVYGNEERYRQYWNTIGKYYTAGDLAVKDKDNYIMILGRSDDILIVSGHNIGSGEVENVLMSHEAVAEAAVIGKPDPIKGDAIKAFIIPRKGFKAGDKLKLDLVYHVRMNLGAVAIPSEIQFVETLPKTRSGKIMRRVLKAIELGKDPGDLSTLDD